MKTAEALQKTYQMSQMVLHAYVGDLSDQDLLVRPVAGCNHIAWQLGHLIASESGLVNSICPGMGLELPPGFAEAHGKENSGIDDPAKFYTKEVYLRLFEESKEKALAALASLSDSDLDQPGPEHFRGMFPTVGDVAILITTHVMMHMGQIVPVRRKLAKPVVI